VRLVLMGPPGSGKGTQGRLLEKKLALPLLGMGDILRTEVANQTALGTQVASTIEAGGFPPSDLVSRVLFERLDLLENFVLDGYPRDLQQAEALEAFLQARGSSLTHAFFFHLNADLLLGRLLGRYTCKNCGAPHARPKDSGQDTGVCGFCGGHDFMARPDDREAVAVARIRASQERDRAVVSYYQQRNILHQVNASQSVEEVQECLLGLLQRPAEDGGQVLES